MQEPSNGSIAERVVPAPAKAASNCENRLGNTAKLQENNDGISLFHFGGPVALSTSCKTATVSSNDENAPNFNPNNSSDHVETDHGCNRNETAVIEEYNLFAASNTLRFSIF